MHFCHSRQIWSNLYLHSNIYCCCFILPFLCLCWYVCMSNTYFHYVVVSVKFQLFTHFTILFFAIYEKVVDKLMISLQKLILIVEKMVTPCCFLSLQCLPLVYIFLVTLLLSLLNSFRPILCLMTSSIVLSLSMIVLDSIDFIMRLLGALYFMYA